MEFSIIGLTPLPPPFWPKLWKILKNINYFMASKSSLVINCIFLIMEFDIADPPPTNYGIFNIFLFFKMKASLISSRNP